jgi:predicted nucleotidyltransferase
MALMKLRYGDSDDPIGAVLALSDRHDNCVDLLVGIRGLDPGAFARAAEVPFQGSSLRVIELEDFIAMKLFCVKGDPNAQRP